MNSDLIALGETMLALAPPTGVSLRDAPALLVDHAGAESNTCVGLARLGLRTAWVSCLGADAASAMGPALLDAVPVSEARAVLVTGVTALIGADAQAAGLALLDRARGLRI